MSEITELGGITPLEPKAPGPIKYPVTLIRYRAKAPGGEVYSSEEGPFESYWDAQRRLRDLNADEDVIQADLLAVHEWAKPQAQRARDFSKPRYWVNAGSFEFDTGWLEDRFETRASFGPYQTMEEARKIWRVVRRLGFLSEIYEAVE